MPRPLDSLQQRKKTQLNYHTTMKTGKFLLSAIAALTFCFTAKAAPAADYTEAEYNKFKAKVEKDISTEVVKGEGTYNGKAYDNVIDVIADNNKVTGYWQDKYIKLYNAYEAYKSDRKDVRDALNTIPAEISLGNKEEGLYDFVTVGLDNSYVLPEGDELTFNLDKGKQTFNETRDSRYAYEFVMDKAYTAPTGKVLVPNSKVLSYYFVKEEKPRWSQRWQQTVLENTYRYLPIENKLTVTISGLKKVVALKGYSPRIYLQDSEDGNIEFEGRGEQDIHINAVGYGGKYALDATKLWVSIETEDSEEFSYSIKKDFDSDTEDYKSYILTVKYLGKEIGKVKTATYTITDGFERNNSNYEGYGKVKSEIRAAQAELKFFTEDGNELSQLNFPKEGGSAKVALYYNGFNNDIYRLDWIKNLSETAYGPYTIKPVLSNTPDYESGSLVKGEGIRLFELTAQSAEEYLGSFISEQPFCNDKRKIEYEYIPGTSASFDVTLTMPYLTTEGVNHAETTIKMGGEDIEDFGAQVEFAAIDFCNYYSLNDIRIYTDIAAFEIGKVSREKEGRLANHEDYLYTVGLKYVPTIANTSVNGNLIVKNTKTNEEIRIPLMGVAVSETKMSELFGDITGISNINAEGETVNGAAFNIAGQRVNNNAKGLIIVNGKKFIKK